MGYVKYILLYDRTRQSFMYMYRGGIAMDIGVRLKKLRLECGWSQRDVAEKTDISRQLIHSYEHGTPPGSANLIKLSEVFNVSLDYLTGFTDEKGRVRESDILALKELEKKLNRS